MRVLFALHRAKCIDKRVTATWREAHRTHYPQLKREQAELREALSHLGLSFLHASNQTILDLRRACGPAWFDKHYNGLLRNPKPKKDA